ncbi:hypothetical protein AB7952_07730 [Streptomyces sp. PG2]
MHALCLSAHTPTALTTLATHWRTHLAAHPEADLAALCRTADTGRPRLAHRAVLTGGSAGELDTALDALVRATPRPPSSATAYAPAPRPGSPSCSAVREPSTPAWAGASTRPTAASPAPSTGPTPSCAPTSVCP